MESGDILNHPEKQPYRREPPIAMEKVINERRTYFLDLKGNRRGRFLKITEDFDGRRSSIILPDNAFHDFIDALSCLVEFDAMLKCGETSETRGRHQRWSTAESMVVAHTPAPSLTFLAFSIPRAMKGVH